MKEIEAKRVKENYFGALLKLYRLRSRKSEQHMADLIMEPLDYYQAVEKGIERAPKYWRLDVLLEAMNLDPDGQVWEEFVMLAKRTWSPHWIAKRVPYGR